tara:strand:+ start:12135 stop:12569 length:435 start_codon:yes stop_codon:yes gene_type:complete
MLFPILESATQNNMELTDYLPLVNPRQPLRPPSPDVLKRMTDRALSATEEGDSDRLQQIEAVPSLSELQQHAGRLWLHTESKLLWSNVSWSWIGVARAWRGVDAEGKQHSHHISARTMCQTLTTLGCLPVWSTLHSPSPPSRRS